MELIKGVPRDLPVVLHVHVAEGHGVREELIQVLGTGRTDPVVQSDWRSCPKAESRERVGVESVWPFPCLLRAGCTRHRACRS